MKCDACNGTGERPDNWLKISVEHDRDCPAPDEDDDGAWTFVSFRRNDNHYRDPAELFPPSIGLRRKLAVGTAFLLDVYEHSGEAWSFSGEGMNDPWDTSSCAGMLLWEHEIGDMGAKTLADRKKDAAGFLEIWNAWANGECFGYAIEDRNGDEIDSSCGFFGTDEEGAVVVSDHLLPAVRSYAEDRGPTRFEIVNGEPGDDDGEPGTLYLTLDGDAKYLVEDLLFEALAA